VREPANDEPVLVEEEPPASAEPGAEEARLRAALAENPGNADARVSLAVLVGARGDRDEADALLAALASDEAGQLQRAEALLRMGRRDEARAAIDALPEASRAQPAARMVAARFALAAGRPDDAVAELAPLARSRDASAPLLALYARALLAAGRVAAASNAYSASMQRDARLPEALLGRAEMAVRSRRPTDAMRLLSRIDQASLRPEHVTRFLFLRGRAQLMAGERAAARRTLEQVVQRAGAPTQAHFFLGEAHAGRDYRAAREAYERYLELEPRGYYATRARRALGLDR